MADPAEERDGSNADEECTTNTQFTPDEGLISSILDKASKISSPPARKRLRKKSSAHAQEREEEQEQEEEDELDFDLPAKNRSTINAKFRSRLRHLPVASISGQVGDDLYCNISFLILTIILC